MKKFILLLLIFTPALVIAQANGKHTSDTTNKKFDPINLWFVMLVKGANRTQDSLTAAKLQEGHMSNMTKMANAGKLLVAGPFMEDADWRGIFILKANSKEEVELLLKDDAAIAAGRLAYRILPWMTGKNCVFK